ncbi:uncharacterized protein E0L32_010435 [Thyridium curvatum]|uniref:Shugoshin n=1 Tax=Thyridium curvatum TaxID=1093900 RepID=A0A507AUG8_9PEZI|nr:uncharacterized protein E0L32_010435 [Thyridium curvatum]TPX07860.1 hypothetical protein E0L32_010435 [Thyridium curvatum]
MARLNEPPASTDSLETLRRKFLRQNRDIARVNSNQSLKIRSLENECARLLSENLDLRGQILRLEKEAEDSSAQRIADHALEIKAKMEAQLLEWGSLLANLGLEPPAKRHSPMGRRIAKSKSSINRSPAQRRPRESVKDEEALAMQEGRLPPIYENKSYPRQTLNRDEILALCEDAESSATQSPDLGPPPVSRYVEDEPVKVDSPPRPEPPADSPAKAEETVTAASPAHIAPVKLDYQRKTTADLDVVSSPSKKPSQVVSEKNEGLRTGSKRKFAVNDENDSSRTSKTAALKSRLNQLGNENQIASQIKSQRKIKELPSTRRDTRDTSTSAPMRRPLAVKSTNQDVSSPRKPTIKAVIPDEATKQPRSAMAREKPREKMSVVIDATKLPQPPQPKSVDIHTDLEPITPFTEANRLAPDTPDRSQGKGGSHDTPPPVDISSNGETSRPSRRSRASVSYAEPNLRDKMRRPTKELYDAVAGEGRYLQRHKSEDPPLEPSSSVKVKLEPESAESWTKLPPAVSMAKEEQRRESVTSPLAKKDPSNTGITATTTGDRRKRTSAMGFKEAAASQALSKVHARADQEAVITATEAHDETDPYEFTTSSPVVEAKDIVTAKDKSVAARPSRSSRRSSMALRDEGSFAEKATTAQPAKSASSRKRASLAVPKKLSMLDGDDEADSSYEEPRRSARDGGSNVPMDRISRRRSMML